MDTTNNRPTAYLIILCDEKLDEFVQGGLFGTAQSMIREKATSVSGDCDELGLSFVMATSFQYEIVGSFGGYLFHVDINIKGKAFRLGLITPPLPEEKFEINVQPTTAEILIYDAMLN